MQDDFDFRNIIHILLEEKEELESDYERVNIKQEVKRLK